MLSILHLEDSLADHELVVHILERSGTNFKFFHVDGLDDFAQVLSTETVDVVLADYHLAGFSGLDAWQWLQAKSLDLPFILVSGAIGEDVVADAMVRGISDYVDKNRLNRLPMVLQRAVEHAQVRRERAAATRELAESRQRLAELTEHLQASIERERADIAREIHDDIGGSLAAVRLDLAWLDRHTQDAGARGHIEAALDMLAHALGASQRIMRHLRPAILDQGLVPAIEWLAQNFTGRTGVPVTLRLGDQRLALAPEIELVAYRCAQEALTNIAKHAQADEVRLELSDLEGVLTLEITDNGRGATPEQLGRLNAFGLIGLRERARNVGGWLDVVSQGRGLSLILSVPLAGASAAAQGDDT